MNLYPGKLFVLEGLDGSGKTSLLQGLILELEKRFPNILMVSAREPGHTVLGKEIREILLQANRSLEDRPTVLAECLLFNAARNQLVETFIKPELQKGAYVFLDRFTLSSYAYQGARGGIEANFLDAVIKEASNSISPDLTLFLDAPWSFCKERLMRAHKPLDRVELMSDEFFEKVRTFYLKAVQEEHGKVEVLDARLSKKDLLLQGLQALEPYFSNQDVSSEI